MRDFPRPALVRLVLAAIATAPINDRLAFAAHVKRCGQGPSWKPCLPRLGRHPSSLPNAIRISTARPGLRAFVSARIGSFGRRSADERHPK